MDIISRHRRLRVSEKIRKLTRETYIDTGKLIYPVFLEEGDKSGTLVESMPGIYRHSIDSFLRETEKTMDLGIGGIMLFGSPVHKDPEGSRAYSEDGLIQRAIREAEKHFPEAVLIPDVCLCAYTDHGHCGIIKDGKVDNDLSVDAIAKTALSYARAGADIIAPSDMMDGRVAAIRRLLDENSFTDTLIMSYSVKYASAFYGPFRDALHSSPSSGDRKQYQMDYSNRKEAVKEALSDIEEGADIIMVKPALAYLDVIHEISGRVNVPVAAYNVSGEYSMIKAAAQKGWIDEKAAVLETIAAINRAGAGMIVTYFACDIAAWLHKGR